MMILHRVASSKQGTFGVLCNEEIPLCVTCEDPWQDNQIMISCIPTGLYSCRKFSGSRFKDVWEVVGVPKRSAILIHAGNTINDTHGCILVGRSFGSSNGLPAVLQSQEALAILRDKLPNEFQLLIK